MTKSAYMILAYVSVLYHGQAVLTCYRRVNPQASPAVRKHEPSLCRTRQTGTQYRVGQARNQALELSGYESRDQVGEYKDARHSAMAYLLDSLAYAISYKGNPPVLVLHISISATALPRDTRGLRGVVTISG